MKVYILQHNGSGLYFSRFRKLPFGTRVLYFPIWTNKKEEAQKYTDAGTKLMMGMDEPHFRKLSAQTTPVEINESEIAQPKQA